MSHTVWSPDGQRIAPELPAHAFTSYQILAPASTHFRKATCEEANCPNFLNGFRTRVDENTELGQQQAYYIRHDRSRRHREWRDEAGLTVFDFEPGQRCFSAHDHMIRIDRDELFFRRPGDWRGNPTGEQPYRHTRAEHWMEDFAENQDRLKTLIDRG